MNIQKQPQGLALLQPSEGINPNDHSYDIGNGAMANVQMQTIAKPLFEAKAQALAEAAKQKELAIKGNQPETPEISLDEALYGATDGNTNTDDSLWRLFGSETQSLLADTADLVATGGAYFHKGLSDLTGTDYYSQEDFDATRNYFDQFSGKNADEVWGYDRTRLNAQQADVGKAVEEGRWGDAFFGGLRASPGTITQSLPTILSFFVGVGEVNAVKAAGTTAFKAAKATGMSTKAAKAVQAEATKAARKQLNLATRVYNSAGKNAGLLNFTSVQTKKDGEEFAKNNGGQFPTATQYMRMWGTNLFMNSLDKMAFKDIVSFRKSGTAKEIWGKLDKPAKYKVAKATAKFIASGALNAGKEGMQEYIQEWGQIFNQNWGTKDTQNFIDVFNKKGNIEALTAAFLGAGAGVAMGTPSNLNTLRQGLNKDAGLNALYNNPKNNVDAGYATTEDQQAHSDLLGQEYNDAEQAFNTLSTAEKEINSVNSANTAAIDQVSKIQAILAQTGTHATDSQANELVKQFGAPEVQQLLKAISANEELASSFDKEQLAQVLSEQPSNAFNALGSMLAERADLLTPEIKETYNNAKTSLESQADTIIQSGAHKVSFEQAKKQLNRSGDVAKSTKNYIDSKAKPVTGDKATIVASAKTKKSKQANIVKRAIETLTGRGSLNEAEKLLSSYDDQTLKDVIKEAQIQANQYAKIQKVQLSSPNLSKAAKLKGAMKKLPEQVKAEQIIAAAKRLRTIRKNVAKTSYAKPKSLKEQFTEFTQSKLADLKVAADKVKAERNKNKAEPKNTNSKPDKNRISKEDKKIIKDAKVMVVTAKKDLDSISKEDLPILEEAIDILVKAGNFGEKFGKQLLADAKAKFEESGVKDVDLSTENIKAGVKSANTRVMNAIKTGTKEDVKNTVDSVITKLTNKIKSKLTLSEKEFLAKVIGKAVAAGKLTNEEAQNQLNKLVKLDEVDLSVDGLKKKLQEAYGSIVNFTKNTANKETRENMETSVKETVKKKVDSFKESELGAELSEDFGTITESLITAKRKGSVELRKQFRKFKKKYDNTSSLEIYQNIKGVFEDLVKGKDTKIVDEVPGTDINTNKDC